MRGGSFLIGVDWYEAIYSQIGITNKFKIQSESPNQYVERLILSVARRKMIYSGKITGSYDEHGIEVTIYCIKLGIMV